MLKDRIAVLTACALTLSFVSMGVEGQEKKRKKRVRPDQAAWKSHAGKAGPTGWRCNVVDPDPKNHGPDGINIHDWDGDGDLDGG
jgi:hypothetical protein